MTQVLNGAAMERWVEVGRRADSKLREVFEKNGLDAGAIDRWASEMIANTFDKISEPQSPSEKFPPKP